MRDLRRLAVDVDDPVLGRPQGTRSAASINRFLAVGALVPAGLVATTLVGEALEYLGSPLDPAPRVHKRSV
jgi:hypothetical protein